MPAGLTLTLAAAAKAAASRYAAGTDARELLEELDHGLTTRARALELEELERHDRSWQIREALDGRR